MPKPRYQHPTVKSRGKSWFAEWWEYPNGKKRHRSHSWPMKQYTKSGAQRKCNQMMLRVNGGGPKGDGEICLRDFWETVYWPIRSRTWTGNTPNVVGYLWSKHIEPQLGKVRLCDFSKATIQLHLGRLADAGLGHSTVDSVRVRLSSVLNEALDNDYIEKNPCRKIVTPVCKTAKQETRSLTETEVRALWNGTAGRDYLWWRIMVLTGARIGELLALRRDDIADIGLRIDEAMVNGTVKAPKRNKKRMAVLTNSLRQEIDAWLSGHTNDILFPTATGKVYHRSHRDVVALLKRGRAIIPDLTFRMCRTTFATLFEGDEADRTSIMGHFDTQFTLEAYRKPIQERRQRSVEALEQRLKVVSIRRAG